ncbi:MAG: hypothetical protein ACJASV_002823 [Pseudorhodobacter sp.]|jgi:hypothetical protein
MRPALPFGGQPAIKAIRRQAAIKAEPYAGVEVNIATDLLGERQKE